MVPKKIVAVAVATLALVAAPLHAQDPEQWGDAIAAMMDHFFAPDVGSHYFGDPPYGLFHPNGQSSYFCIEIRDRGELLVQPVGPLGRRGPIVESDSLTSLIRSRIEDSFRLEYIPACQGPDDFTAPYSAPDGSPANKIRVVIYSVAESSKGVALEFDPGSGFGYSGWNCLVGPASAGTWQVTSGTCRGFDT